jgi:predicted Zn-dependent peptidase
MGPVYLWLSTEEPKQEGERRTIIETEAQPFLWMAYKRPTGIHPDDAALNVLASALSSGRTGVMYKEMVEERKLALGAAVFSNFLSEKYPGLLTFVSVPAVGKTVEENEKAFHEIIERVKTKKIDDVVLNRVKTQVRASLIRGLDSNMGLAMQLAENYQLYGDWRNMFKQIGEIEKVTADDVMRVAKTYLLDSGRTVVYSKNPKKGDSK